MNTTQVQQPPTFIPPPQQYMPGPNPPPPFPMQTPEKQKGRIINIAFFATVAFFALSNPIAYRFMNQAFMVVTGRTNEILTETGAPTMKGHFLHSVVFFVAMFIILMKK